MMFKLLLLVVLAVFVVHGEELPRRVVEVRGLPKSGTTWLEMTILALLSCSERGMDASFAETAASYSRENNFFIFESNQRVVTNYSLSIKLKHILTRPITTQTVFIFRDPKDTALSFYDFMKRPIEQTMHQHAESLTWLLNSAQFSVEQLLIGDYQSASMPNSFFINYELAQLCPLMVVLALSDFLGADYRCAHYAVEETSFEKMKALEGVKLVPGRQHLVKVNRGEICRAINEQRYVPLDLPGEWSEYFGVNYKGECALIDYIMGYGEC